jgi:hypothetical protein
MTETEKKEHFDDPNAKGGEENLAGPPQIDQSEPAVILSTELTVKKHEDWIAKATQKFENLEKFNDLLVTNNTEERLLKTEERLLKTEERLANYEHLLHSKDGLFAQIQELRDKVKLLKKDDKQWKEEHARIAQEEAKNGLKQLRSEIDDVIKDHIKSATYVLNENLKRDLTSAFQSNPNDEGSFHSVLQKEMKTMAETVLKVSKRKTEEEEILTNEYAKTFKEFQALLSKMREEFGNPSSQAIQKSLPRTSTEDTKAPERDLDQGGGSKRREPQQQQQPQQPQQQSVPLYVRYLEKNQPIGPAEYQQYPESMEGPPELTSRSAAHQQQQQQQQQYHGDDIPRRTETDYPQSVNYPESYPRGGGGSQGGQYRPVSYPGVNQGSQLSGGVQGGRATNYPNPLTKSSHNVSYQGPSGPSYKGQNLSRSFGPQEDIEGNVSFIQDLNASQQQQQQQSGQSRYKPTQVSKYSSDPRVQESFKREYMSNQ